MVKLRNRIRVHRAEHRMSQQDLADAIGVSRKTINTIENGRFVPTAITALKISSFFNVAFEDVFTLEPDATDTSYDRMDASDNLLPSFLKKS